MLKNLTSICLTSVVLAACDASQKDQVQASEKFWTLECKTPEQVKVWLERKRSLYP